MKIFDVNGFEPFELLAEVGGQIVSLSFCFNTFIYAQHFYRLKSQKVPTFGELLFTQSTNPLRIQALFYGALKASQSDDIEVFNSIEFDHETLSTCLQLLHLGLIGFLPEIRERKESHKHIKNTEGTNELIDLNVLYHSLLSHGLSLKDIKRMTLRNTLIFLNIESEKTFENSNVSQGDFSWFAGGDLPYYGEND